MLFAITHFGVSKLCSAGADAGAETHSLSGDVIWLSLDGDVGWGQRGRRGVWGRERDRNWAMALVELWGWCGVAVEQQCLGGIMADAWAAGAAAMTWQAQLYDMVMTW